ncbi:MAG: hypothetical protein JWO06_2434, partial [Bacteroidota bacterium]|nr:hypothetical protein [Bacteroidota bacterium]
MEAINELFGVNAEKLVLYQMVLRGLVTFFAAIIYIRLAGIRTIGAQNGLNQLTMLIMGAILGRGIVSA